MFKIKPSHQVRMGVAIRRHRRLLVRRSFWALRALISSDQAKAWWWILLAVPIFSGKRRSDSLASVADVRAPFPVLQLHPLKKFLSCIGKKITKRGITPAWCLAFGHCVPVLVARFFLALESGNFYRANFFHNAAKRRFINIGKTQFFGHNIRQYMNGEILNS